MSSKLSSRDLSLAAGLNYLLARQSPDGSWTDWELPPGSSSSWTTGYIGYKLRLLPPLLKIKAAPHLAEAARWLLNQFEPGGWGFNRSTGADADSTSCAILFLVSSGQPAPEEAYRSLARHQNPDGGFCTYLPEGQANSWNISHPDVTPLALLALLTQPVPNRPAIARGLEYVLKQRKPDGLWSSFWWRSSLYGTEACLSFLQTQSVAFSAPAMLTRVQPANAFEKALLLSSLLYSDAAGFESAIHELAGQLIADQQADGSWKEAPILRITRRDCYEPWASTSAGPLFPDPHRLFTTATALHALARSGVLDE